MIYFVDSIKQSFDGQGRFSAMSKPRKDFLQTFSSLNDSKIIYLIDHISDDEKSLVRQIIDIYFKIYIRINALWKLYAIKKTVVFFQYPFVTGVMMHVLRFLKLRNKIVVLIHDIETIRQNKQIKEDKQIFKYADCLVLHSPQMAETVRKLGYKGKIKILEFFDYLVDGKINDRNIESPFRVVFAGNLAKSGFLKDISEIETTNDFCFYFYGKGKEALPVNNKDFVYKGFFEANNIADLEGNWGLVWDGNSVETCDGELGNYLRYNASFKFSLYIAANMPVIVWSQSAIAQYVKKYNLGIVVDSLHDVRKKLQKLSLEELTNIKKSVMNYSLKLRTGEKARNVFSQVLAEI